MKHTITMGVAGIALLAISGCSSMQGKSTVAKSVEVDDAAYIAQVERVAMDRGVMVRWVNPPKKHVATQL